MSVQDLAYVPRNPSDWQGFAFSNQASHRDINRAIFQQQTTPLPISGVTYDSTSGSLTVITGVQPFLTVGAKFVISGITGGTGGGNYAGLNGTWSAVTIGSNGLATIVTSGLGTITTVTGTPTLTGVGSRIDDFILSPFDPDNMGQWPWNHQTMHNQAWAAVGGSGYNLLDVQWDDERIMQMWISLHSDEHNRLEALLGL